MKKLFAILILLCAVRLQAAVVTIQVTIGASVTQVLSAGAHQNCRWIVIQNNATHNIHIGDKNTSSTRGIQLASGAPGGSFFIGPDSSGSARDLGGWYIAGTQNDVIDIIYDDGQ